MLASLAMHFRDIHPRLTVETETGDTLNPLNKCKRASWNQNGVNFCFLRLTLHHSSDLPLSPGFVKIRLLFFQHHGRLHQCLFVLH